MDLNDPFGRLRRRDEAAYETLCARLADAGITSADAVDALLRRARRNTALFAVLVLAGALVLSLLVPKLAPVIVAAALLALAAAGKAALQGQRLLRRRQAELAAGTADRG